MILSRFKALILAGAGAPDPFACPEGGGKGGPPPAPDFRGSALEQAAASKELATQNTWANRPTLNTPWGQQTWEASAGKDPSTGQDITNWTSNINLTPEQQTALDSQQRIQEGKSGAAESLLGQATGAFQTPFDWQGMPGRGQVAQQTGNLTAAQAGPELAAAQAGNVQDSQSRAYGIMSQMLEPARSQSREALDAKLLASGVDPNSEQAKRSRGEQAEQFSAQDKQMMAQALGEGRADVSTQYGMGQSEAAQRAAMQQQRFGQMSAQQAQQAMLDQQRFGQQGTIFGQQNQQRQQAIAEEQLRRGMPLNELNALLTGQQVQNPSMPGFNTATQAQAPQLLDAAKAQGNYGLEAAKQKAESGTDIGSLVGSVGGMAAMAGMF
jgi:hypothetical protein